VFPLYRFMSSPSFESLEAHPTRPRLRRCFCFARNKAPGWLIFLILFMSQTHWEEDWELLNMSTVPFFTAGFLASQVFTDHTPRNGEWTSVWCWNGRSVICRWWRVRFDQVLWRELWLRRTRTKWRLRCYQGQWSKGVIYRQTIFTEGVSNGRFCYGWNQRIISRWSVM